MSMEYTKNMKLLVIGGNGYIGSRLSRELSKEYSVTNVSRSPASYNRDILFYQTNLANLSTETMEVYDVIVFTTHVNEPGVFAKFVDRCPATILFIYFSTAAIYNEVSNNYIENKKACEQILLDSTLTNVSILRLGTVSGYSFKPRMSVMNTMVRDANHSKIISVLNGHVKKAILGFNDLTRAVRAIIRNNGTPKKIYDIGSFNTTVKSLAMSLSDILGCFIEEKIVGDLFDYEFTLNTVPFTQETSLDFHDTILTIVQDTLHYDTDGNSTFIYSCRCCKSDKLKLILDLGMQPLANNCHIPNQDKMPEKYPLAVYVCESCFHCQLSYVVDPKVIFDHYLYVSGTTKTMRDFFKANALFIDEGQENTQKTVLDIACNDGSQLNELKLLGWDTYGVDPASNLYDITSKEHKIINDYWCERVAKKLHMKFDVVLAQNVFAHVHDVDEFLQACKSVMVEHSKLYIQTSQATMIEKSEFDTVYHEHLSFFNTNSMKHVVEKNDLHLNDVQITEVHGNSYIFEILLNKNKIHERVMNQMEKEKSHGYYNMQRYLKYGLNCVVNIKRKREYIQSLPNRVVGYGACAKANTLFNAMKITNRDIEFIIDDNPLKQGRYTPGTNIPIVAQVVLDDEKDGCGEITLIVLAWNYYAEIVQKVNHYNFKCIININDI